MPILGDKQKLKTVYYYLVPRKKKNLLLIYYYAEKQMHCICQNMNYSVLDSIFIELILNRINFIRINLIKINFKIK